MIKFLVSAALVTLLSACSSMPGGSMSGSTSMSGSGSMGSAGSMGMGGGSAPRGSSGGGPN